MSKSRMDRHISPGSLKFTETHRYPTQSLHYSLPSVRQLQSYPHRACITHYPVYDSYSRIHTELALLTTQCTTAAVVSTQSLHYSLSSVRQLQSYPHRACITHYPVYDSCSRIHTELALLTTQCMTAAVVSTQSLHYSLPSVRQLQSYPHRACITHYPVYDSCSRIHTELALLTTQCTTAAVVSTQSLHYSLPSVRQLQSYPHRACITHYPVYYSCSRIHTELALLTTQCTTATVVSTQSLHYSLPSVRQLQSYPHRACITHYPVYDNCSRIPHRACMTHYPVYDSYSRIHTELA